MNSRTLRLSAFFLAWSFALVAQAQIAVGPEVHIGKDVTAPATASQSLGDVAWNGSNGFAVWTEPRASQVSVVGTRVAADGTPLDPDGIVLVTVPTPGNQPLSAALAIRGSGYLLAWSTPTTIFTSPLDIDAGGHATLLHPEGVAVLRGDDFLALRLATNGSRFLAVGDDQANNSVIAEAELLDENGNPLQSVRVDYTIAGHTSVASNGSGFAVATVGGTFGVALTILDSDGVKKAKLSISAAQRPALTNLGGNYIVVWTLTGNVNDTIVAPDGTVISTNNRLVTTGTNNLDDVAVAVTGGEGLAIYGAVGQQGCGGCTPPSELHAVRFDNIGNPEGPPFVVTNEPAANRNPHVVWSGSAFLTVYERESNAFDTSGQVVSVAIGANGDVGPLRPLTRSVLPQFGVAAVDGRSFFAVTTEVNGTSFRLFVDNYELPNPGSGVTAVASDGDGWMVAWVDSSGNVHATLFRSDRTLLVDTTLTLTTPDLLAAAFDGVEYVVVGTNGNGVRAARMIRSGAVLDDTLVLSGGRAQGLTITGFNGRAVVSANAAPSALLDPPCSCTVMQTWTITGGSIIGSSSLTTNTTGALDSTNDGTNAYVVSDNGQIYRVDGTTAAATLIATDAAEGAAGVNVPSIARLGSRFLILWFDGNTELLSTDGSLERISLPMPAGARLVRAPDETAAAVIYDRVEEDPPYNGAVLFFARPLLATSRGRIVSH